MSRETFWGTNYGHGWYEKLYTKPWWLNGNWHADFPLGACQLSPRRFSVLHIYFGYNYVNRFIVEIVFVLEGKGFVMKSDNSNEPITLGILKKEKSSKPAFVLICFMLLLGTCFGLPYIKDYINNNNNSFSIWVRGLLNNFTSDNEPAPSPVAPSDDKNVLSKSSTISYQGIKLTNFSLEGTKISFDMSSNTDFNLDEHKLFLEIYGTKDLLTRVKLTGSVNADVRSVTNNLYKLTVNSGELYYGKIVNLSLDDYPIVSGISSLMCTLNNRTITYSFEEDILKSVHDNVTNNDTSDIDAYMALLGKYQELSNRLVSNGLVSTTEETDSGFVFNADVPLGENIRETLGEDYDYNYFYMNAPLKEVSYDMLTKGFDCKWI